MNFKEYLEIDAPATDCAERVRIFLESLGYIRIADSELRFQRGSRLGSMTSFSPKKWNSLASVEVHTLDKGQSSVSLVIDVKTTGQRVTQRETEYWRKEIDAFRNAVQTGDIRAEELMENHQAHTASIKKGFLVFFGVTIAVGVLAGIAAALVNPAFTNFGAILGPLAGFTAARKHWGL